MGAYVALGASAFIPLLHGVQLYGLDYMLEFSGMRWYLLELVLYGLGVTLYGVRWYIRCFLFSQIRDTNQQSQSRVPERFAPGKFDVWFSSHQIFHVSILCAMYVNTIALTQAFTACHTLDICSIQAARQLQGK